jgi:hypothetical protein
MADTIALIFDFDDTLVPDSTSLLLESFGIDAERFWMEEAKPLVEAGYDQPLAYLNLMLDKIGADKPLGNLTIEDLRKFGQSLDGKFFSGLDTLKAELQDIAHEVDADIDVELYIISGGLEQIMEGSQFVRSNFAGFYGCLFDSDGDGVISKVKRTITFTEKTRYLFEINKGVTSAIKRSQPYAVNKTIAEKERRVPFSNMIYVGDGLTDIPCFSLLRKNKGLVFGIMKQGSAHSAKQGLLQFLKTERVQSLHFPKYAATDELGAILRSSVSVIAAQIGLAKEQAFK